MGIRTRRVALSAGMTVALAASLGAVVGAAATADRLAASV